MKRINFKEAEQRFILQGRDDIKLCEDGYVAFDKNAKFWDCKIQKHFWARPHMVYIRNSSHPERMYEKSSKKLRLPFLEAQTKFVDRTDIELCEDEYNGWSKKSKFYDKIEKDYFWSIPNDVFRLSSCHPKRSVKNNAIKNTISFIKAKERFVEQGRTDIELCEDEYSGWKKKSKFWDNIQNDYFMAVPAKVFDRKDCHPKRRPRSKAQLELFEILRKEFSNQEVFLEKVINNGDVYYKVDITIPQYNIVIEFNGDYWHCNPQLYKEDYFHKKSKKYAKDIWKRDEIRKYNLETIGYKILVIWENDYNKNKEKIIKNLINEIKIIAVKK